MTISSTNNRNDYVGADTTATYNYTFKAFVAADLLVTVRNTTTDVETTLTLTTDYTITGVGVTAGGTIVLVDASQDWISASSFLDSGYALTIRRVPALTQNTDIRNQGDFFPEVHEDVFDKQVAIDQKQQDEIDRSAKLPETVAASAFDATIPAAIVGENQLTITTNAVGTAFIAGPTASEISTAQASAIAAAADAVSTAADAVSTAADAASTASDATDTGIDAAATAADAIATAADAVSTAADAVSTASDATDTGVDAAATAADVITTNADVVLTNADVVTTNADAASSTASASAAATSESNAATSEANALAAAASSQWQDVSYKVFSDSPIAPVDASAGLFYAVDCTSGDVVINLPAISVLTLTAPWSIGIKKTDSTANTITINRSGSDTIDGSTSVVLSLQGAGVTLIPDADGTPDDWTSLAFGGVIVTDAVVAKTTTYTATTADNTITVDSSSGTFTVTLFTAVGNTGHTIRVKKTDTSFTAVTIDGDGSETIDGSTTTTVNTENESVTLQSNGTNWVIIGRHIPSEWTSFTPVLTAFGTVTSSVGMYRRVGDSLEVEASFIGGTGTASAGQFRIPNSLTMDDAKISGGTQNQLGFAARNVGTNVYTSIEAMFILWYDGSDTTDLFYGGHPASSAVNSKAPGNDLNSGEGLIYNYKVPITGWKS